MRKALKRIESRITGMHDGITGDLSGVRGDLTYVRGDLDLCEINEKERAAGVNINDLIEP